MGSDTAAFNVRVNQNKILSYQLNCIGVASA